jgi:peptidoglycan biosynthesis protein MviN/MurJ (putative lipid II flippase)
MVARLKGWRQSSDHRTILTAMMAVSLFVAIAKVLGAAKEVAIAAAFGAGPPVDAYVFLFNILNWPSAVLASVFLTVLVPFFIKPGSHSSTDLRIFKEEFLGTTLIGGIVIAVIATAALFIVLPLGLTGLPPQTVAIANTMLVPMLVSMPLSLTAGFLAANLMSGRKQTNTLLEGVPSLCIFVIVLFAPMQSPSKLAWATLIGFATQVTLLAALRPEGERVLLPRLSWRSPAWATVLTGFGIVLAGQAITTLTGVIDQVMIAGQGPGANATLGYAGRLLSLVLGLGATAIGRALLPTLSTFGQDNTARARRVTAQWATALFLFGLAFSIIAWTFAPWGVALVFERGAFGPGDTVRVAEALRWGLLQVPFYFSGIVLVQLIASRGDYRKFLYIGGLNLVVKVAANAMLIPRCGVPGALIATSIMYAAGLPALWIFSRK